MTDPDLTGGELTDLPNKKYQQFFDRFAEIDTLKVEEWKPVHLLGFFVRKYQERYNLPYQWKYNSPSPSKCFEVFQIKKLSMLLSSNPVILKEYIDWAFLTVVPRAKKRLTSISFLTREENVNPYKMNLLSGKPNINRSTALPEAYRQVLAHSGFTANTYGELAFLQHMEQTPAIFQTFQKLVLLGLKPEILSKLV